MTLKRRVFPRSPKHQALTKKELQKIFGTTGPPKRKVIQRYLSIGESYHNILYRQGKATYPGGKKP